MPFKIGTILKDAGIINNIDIDRALELQKQTGYLFGESLLQLNLCNKEEINYALITQIENNKNIHKKGLNFKELSLLFKEIIIDKKYIYTLFLFGILSALFSSTIVVPVIIGFITDHIIPSGNIPLLLQASLMAVGAFVIGNLFEFFSVIIGMILNVKIANRISNKVFLHLNCLYYPFFTKYEKGDLLSRLNENLDEVNKNLETIFPFFFKNIFLIIFVVIILLTLSVSLTLASFVIIIFTLVIPAKISNSSSKYLNNISVFIGKISLFLKEIFDSSRYIKQNNKVENFLSTFKIKMKTFMFNDAGKWMGWTNAFNVKVIFNYLINATILFYGGHLVIDNKLSLGNLFAYYILIAQLIPQMDYFYKLFLTLQIIKPNWRRIKNILDFPIGNKNSFLESNHNFLTINKLISIKNLSFKHKLSDNFILEKINLKLKSGEIYPIIGKSGTGKSTFLKLILGLYKPTSGYLLFDNNNISQISYYDLWANIAYMEQETFIFNDISIYENIKLGSSKFKNNITDDEIYNAAKKAYIYNFINSLPDGFNTIPAKSNLVLSGGEKQRLSLARIFLKDPKIIIMDEPTSALDPENTQSIINSVIKEAKNKIIIISTHKLEYIVNFKNLLHFKDGRINFIENNKRKVKTEINKFRLELNKDDK